MTGKPKTPAQRKRDEIQRRKDAGFICVDRKFWVKPEKRAALIAELTRVKKLFEKGEK